MARVNVHVVSVLVTLAAVVLFSSPVMAGRMNAHQPIDNSVDFRPFFHRSDWGVNGAMCIPQVSHLIEDHEGRHKRAYDHENGFRAVGAGYNLDDDKEQRKAELKLVACADYDKVYKGEESLDDKQISALLILDAKRALNRAKENVRELQDFCCRIQAVFGDIQHWAGRTEDFPKSDLKKFIEQARKQQFESAADELEKTEWCSQEANERRCDDNVDLVAKGCEKNEAY